MTEPFLTTIHLRDPAIDWRKLLTTKEGYGAYQQFVSSRDANLIKPYCLQGKTPTEFVLQEIPHDLEPWIMQTCKTPTAAQLLEDDDVECATVLTYNRAFMCSVVLVRNLTTTEGTIIAEWEPPKGEGAFRDAMNVKGLERFSAGQRVDVGALAYQKLGFPPGTEPTFVLPRTYLDLLGPRVPPSAVPISPSPAQPSETPSPDAQAA